MRTIFKAKDGTIKVVTNGFTTDITDLLWEHLPQTFPAALALDDFEELGLAWQVYGKHDDEYYDTLGHEYGLERQTNEANADFRGRIAHRLLSVRDDLIDNAEVEWESYAKEHGLMECE